MFVIFGASTDIGQRLGTKLRTKNQPVRSISRSAPGCVAADLATGEGLKAALDGAEVVISCAHARHTERLIAALPPAFTVSSSWARPGGIPAYPIRAQTTCGLEKNSSSLPEPMASCSIRR